MHELRQGRRGARSRWKSALKRSEEHANGMSPRSAAT
eukprot:CAMPEP_0172644032 /NCGR_PEP_ID=MMETSP1068-20121228/239002_1 /TAXON_ID=35684 /ORGANISM="Pseudopedinella elastica, Strain CCMP716" /LENGTH=36 /DNA_ID= /DNA_START= /DNA_END= /DNA_ORIENTATION=